MLKLASIFSDVRRRPFAVDVSCRFWSYGEYENYFDMM